MRGIENVRRGAGTLVALLMALAMAGCSWRGEPKQPIDAAYHKCKQTCKGTCAADGTCLPPIVEDGK